MKISSSTTFIIWAFGLLAALVWKTYMASAPFDGFALAWTTGATTYWTKRLIQKREAFSGCAENGGNGEDK